ncbi:17419_t:CDS:1, partial [Cetraspora pellucida]
GENSNDRRRDSSIKIDLYLPNLPDIAEMADIAEGADLVHRIDRTDMLEK